MTAAQNHKCRRKARNAAYASRSKTKPKRVVGTTDQKAEDPRSEFSDEAWHDMVSTAAYFRAKPAASKVVRPRTTGMKLKPNCVRVALTPMCW